MENSTRNFYKNNCVPKFKNGVSTKLQKPILLLHQLYSPDISPCNYDLFCKLKELMKGLRFPNMKSLSLVVTRCMHELNKFGICDGVEKLPE